MEGGMALWVKWEMLEMLAKLVTEGLELGEGHHLA
jgi:hypothetical protein